MNVQQTLFGSKSIEVHGWFWMQYVVQATQVFIDIACEVPPNACVLVVLVHFTQVAFCPTIYKESSSQFRKYIVRHRPIGVPSRLKYIVRHRPIGVPSRLKYIVRHRPIGVR